MLNIGDRVMVYTDPLTRKNQEGPAVVAKVHTLKPYRWNTYVRGIIHDCDVTFLEDKTQKHRRQILELV